MAQRGPRVMTLKLQPPELGSLEIRVSVQHDLTSVTFTTQHAFVRDLVEAGLPRLREMLTEGGLNLAQADVFTRADRGGHGGTNPRGRGLGYPRMHLDGDADLDPPLSGFIPSPGIGLVDYYA
jgi:flagellar hook-length control protein FliK